MLTRRETLLSASAVKLYGRVIRGLNIKLENARDELGNNRFLRAQLEAQIDSAGNPAPPRLARIYGFSYYGRYTPLSRPAIFLVHGRGTPASPQAPAVLQKDPTKQGVFVVDVEKDNEEPENNSDAASKGPFVGRLSTGPNDIDRTGEAAKNAEFAAGIRVWEYDRADFSLRLDIDSGPLERILIDREEVGEDMPYFRGQRTRLRGSTD